MLNPRDVLVAAIAACVTVGAVTLAQSGKQPLMGSSVFDWNAAEVKQQKTGSRRQFFQSATATLDELECHVTTVNPGESPHPPHQHPEEEIIIIKEGTVEALVNGEMRRVGPGSVIFQASNQMHGLRNIGQTPATYHVFRWKSPGASKAKS
jgi:quercetin dioxygenase-like cupin family protein